MRRWRIISKKWLEEDVLYTITDDEKVVFKKLQTTEEKERFIEQFWTRRDPSPRSSYNEFKEEHYRRLQYANERFASGIPGWKTDRGMIYIKYGAPDRLEAHPSGGNLQPTFLGGRWIPPAPIPGSGGSTVTWRASVVISRSNL